MALNIDNNPRTRTWKELVHELTDTLVANPELADRPAAFTTDSGEAIDSGAGTIWFVRGFHEEEAGDLLMTRGL